MNWLTQPLERVFLRPLRSLGGLSFDVVVSEEHEDTLTIAKHPVEQGANISDHAYRNPCKVVIKGASSESTYGLPVWDSYNVTLYNALLALQNAREPLRHRYGQAQVQQHAAGEADRDHHPGLRARAHGDGGVPRGDHREDAGDGGPGRTRQAPEPRQDRRDGEQGPEAGRPREVTYCIALKIQPK